MKHEKVKYNKEELTMANKETPPLPLTIQAQVLEMEVDGQQVDLPAKRKIKPLPRHPSERLALMDMEIKRKTNSIEKEKKELIDLKKKRKQLSNYLDKIDNI